MQAMKGIKMLSTNNPEGNRSLGAIPCAVLFVASVALIPTAAHAGCDDLVPPCELTCETHEPLPIPNTDRLSPPGEITGELTITWTGPVNHNGPDVYQYFTIEGVATGANATGWLKHLQLKNKANGVVKDTQLIDRSHSIDPVTVSATYGVFSDSIPVKTIQLVAVSEDVAHPIWSKVLDEITITTPQIWGTISVDPPLCNRAEDDDPLCAPTVAWDARHLRPDYDWIYVTYQRLDTGDGKVWRQRRADNAGAAQACNLPIVEEGAVFSLYASANGAYGANDFDALVANPDNLLLADAIAESVAHDVILSPVDHQPMRITNPSDPLEFVGVLGNGICLNPNACTDTPEGVEQAAELSAAAGFRYFRRSIIWKQVQGDTIMKPFNWQHYDTMFQAFTSKGIKPWITFTKTPIWAMDTTLPPTHACNTGNYQPEDFPVADEHLDNWSAFIAAAVDRYGPGPNCVLEIPCENWEVWQEPDINWCADPVRWQELHTRAYNIIKANNANARVWAPNIFFNYQKDHNKVMDWVNFVLNGDIDAEGLAVHTFFRPERRNELDQAYNCVAALRARIDANANLGVNFPIAITAFSYPGSGDMFQFRRNLSECQREQAYKEFIATLANAGAEYAQWYNVIDDVEEGVGIGKGMLSPNLGGPTVHHEPYPQYCGQLRVRDYLTGD